MILFQFLLVLICLFSKLRLFDLQYIAPYLKHCFLFLVLQVVFFNLQKDNLFLGQLNQDSAKSSDAGSRPAFSLESSSKFSNSDIHKQGSSLTSQMSGAADPADESTKVSQATGYTGKAEQKVPVPPSNDNEQQPVVVGASSFKRIEPLKPQKLSMAPADSDSKTDNPNNLVAGTGQQMDIVKIQQDGSRKKILTYPNDQKNERREGVAPRADDHSRSFEHDARRLDTFINQDADREDKGDKQQRPTTSQSHDSV